MNKRLLLVASSSTHTYNYLHLIQDYFDDVLLVSDRVNNESGIKNIQIDFSFKNPFNFIKAIRTLRRSFKEFNPNLIHIHQADTSAFTTIFALKKFNVPFLITLYGSDILITPEKGFFYKKMIEYILFSTNYFTSDSQYLESVVRNKFQKNNSKILIANFGIRVEHKSMVKEDFIYSNRLHKPLYRIDKIINGFSEFIKNPERSNWNLVIAGEGPETKKLKELAVKLGVENRVRFVGWLNSKENNDLYRKAKVFVSIPESDATSISLLEAMYYDCIPVVSSLPANYEWIIDDLNGVIAADLDKNYLEEAVNLDFDQAKQINQFLIQQKAIPEINKNKFLDFYDKIYSGKV